jgi:hypothetical protein
MSEDEGKEPRRSPLNADGMERPRFLLDFPEDPELDRLIAAFEAGNFARVRKDAPRLAETTADPAVKEAALELRRRIDPDPLAKYLLAVSFVLLLVLTIWAYAQASH